LKKEEERGASRGRNNYDQGDSSKRSIGARHRQDADRESTIQLGPEERWFLGGRAPTFHGECITVSPHQARETKGGGPDRKNKKKFDTYHPGKRKEKRAKPWSFNEGVTGEGPGQKRGRG